MTTPKPFRPDTAAEAFPAGTTGDVILPICLPEPGLMMGENLAVVVLETIEGQRVGVPMGLQALSDLRVVVTEALRMLQAGDGDAVQ